MKAACKTIEDVCFNTIDCYDMSLKYNFSSNKLIWFPFNTSNCLFFFMAKLFFFLCIIGYGSPEINLAKFEAVAPAAAASSSDSSR